MTLYIFDSHRPINHNNIHSKQNIVIIDDGKLPSLDQIPDENDMEQANQEGEASEEDFDAEALANETEEKRERPDEPTDSRVKKERK